MASSQRTPRLRARTAVVLAIIVLVAVWLVGTGNANVAASLLLASLWLFLAFRTGPRRPLPRLPRRDEAEEPG
ncbi:MAG TPA: hypothetical protein VKZ89_19815 [Thermobifida alba]|nr:hypothetical protein [Thermobifida alba]